MSSERKVGIFSEVFQEEKQFQLLFEIYKKFLNKSGEIDLEKLEKSFINLRAHKNLDGSERVTKASIEALFEELSIAFISYFQVERKTDNIDERMNSYNILRRHILAMMVSIRRNNPDQNFIFDTQKYNWEEVYKKLNS
jgi:hypothetical protein